MTSYDLLLYTSSFHSLFSKGKNPKHLFKTVICPYLCLFFFFLFLLFLPFSSLGWSRRYGGDRRKKHSKILLCSQSCVYHTFFWLLLFSSLFIHQKNIYFPLASDHCLTQNCHSNISIHNYS